MNVSYTEILNNDKVVLNRVKFSILLILQIPSIVLYIFIFEYFVRHRSFLRTPQNQALLILLIVNFLQASCDLPMVIHFYYLGRVSPETAAYCTWWTFFEYTLSVSSEYLMATISIQRHILIFNGHILRIRKKRFLLHHLPLLLCVAYPTLLYLALVVIYPCDDTHWDFSSNLCALANCYLVDNRILATFDWALDNGMPVVIILLANVALVARVVWQKRRRQQSISWQKQRRMTLQLLSISCLYMIAWLPNTITAVIQEISASSFIAQVQSNYIFDLLYLVCLLIPWVCVGMLPEFKKWILERLHLLLATRNDVAPIRITHTVIR
jgi:hypothetical protein